MKLFYFTIISIVAIFTLSCRNDTNSKALPESDKLNTAPTYDTEKVVDTEGFVIEKSLNGRDFSMKLSDDFIQLYKSQASVSTKPLTPINRLFLDPINLLILNKLTQKAVEVFEENNVPYWAYGGTMLSADRFNSLMPWDDDSDFGFDLSDYRNKEVAIKKSMKEKGLFIVSSECFLGNKTCYVRFTQEAYFDVVREYEPSFTEKTIKVMYDGIPKSKCNGEIDFFPFYIDSNWVREVNEPWYKVYVRLGGHKNGYHYASIFPLQKVRINGFTLNSIHEPKDFYKIWYGSENILYSLYMRSHTSYYKPVSISDVRQYPDFITLIREYLTFVFGEEFGGFSEAYQQFF